MKISIPNSQENLKVFYEHFFKKVENGIEYNIKQAGITGHNQYDYFLKSNEAKINLNAMFFNAFPQPIKECMKLPPDESYIEIVKNTDAVIVEIKKYGTYYKEV